MSANLAGALRDWLLNNIVQKTRYKGTNVNTVYQVLLYFTLGIIPLLDNIYTVKTYCYESSWLLYRASMISNLF